MKAWRAAGLLGLLGCRGLVGVDGKDFSDDPPAGACAPFASGGASLRFTHAAPTTGSFHLCLQPASGAAASLTEGASCAGAVRFGQRTGQVKLPPGSYRAWAVEASLGCSGPRLAEQTLELARGQQAELVLGRAGQRLALAQVDEPGGAGLRLLNAIVGAETAEVRAGALALSAPSLGVSARLPAGQAAALELTEPAVARAKLEGPVPGSATVVAVGVAGDEIYAPRLLLCDDRGDGGLSDCRSSPTASFVVETLNNRFSGNDAYAPERLAALIEALKASSADAVCLQEITFPVELRAQVAAAVASTFPHSVYFTTSEQTPLAFGPKPTSSIPDTPTCAAYAEEVDAAVACAATSCSTIPGSADGALTSEQCFIEACGGQFLAAFKDDPSRVCATCLRTAFGRETLQQAADRCRLQPGMPLRLNGDNEVLILSRHPVEEPECMVLPSTGARRVLLRAVVRKPDSPALDLYCTRLGTVQEGVQYVYYGLYGGGSTHFDAWSAEQRLQAEIVSEAVMLRSKNRRALLAGWMGASHPVMDGSTIVIEGFAEATLTTLEQTLLNATPPEGLGVCTACRDNPLYNDSFFDRRTDHVFLRGFDPDDVASMDLAYNEANIAVMPSSFSKGKGLIPISDHYGLRATIQLTR